MLFDMQTILELMEKFAWPLLFLDFFFLIFEKRFIEKGKTL